MPMVAWHRWQKFVEHMFRSPWIESRLGSSCILRDLLHQTCCMVHVESTGRMLVVCSLLRQLVPTTLENLSADQHRKAAQKATALPRASVAQTGLSSVCERESQILFMGWIPLRVPGLGIISLLVQQCVVQIVTRCSP